MNEELQEASEDVQTDEVQAQPEQEQPQEAARPDWLPDKFKTEQDFATSYQNLEKRLHERSENFRDQIISELQEQASGDIPVSPADYQVALQTEDGEDFEVEEGHMLDWFRNTAHNLGLNQEQFNTIVGEYSQMNAMTGPDWNVESQTLGEHAERRLERVDTWASSHLSEASYDVFASLPASAGMVQFFEEMMENNGQPKFNMTSETAFQENVTQDDLKNAQADPKYWRDKDPVHIAKVRAMSRQIGLQKHGSLTLG